jgi:hypothetical protein
MHTEDKEPDGTAAGQTRNASQQSKHFQCGSATVLCTTVNSEACLPLGNVERLVRENRAVPRMDHAPIWRWASSNRGSASHFFSKMPPVRLLNAPRH